MAENEKLEGIQMEELEALAGEFTLDDLAQYDNELEFDVTDLESIKPVYTKKERNRLIFMSNKVSSIIKWVLAGLGLVGVVLFILAMVSPDISEALTTTVSKAVVGVLATVSNLLPISLMEVLVVALAAGLLIYIGFLVYKTIREKEGVKIAGIWMQFVYTLFAVIGVGFLLFSLCYGVTIFRPYLYKTSFKGAYQPQLFTEQTMGSALIYYTEKVNEVAVGGMSNIFFAADGSSQYASKGSSIEEIGAAVNECFKVAAKDKGFAFLDGPDVVVKEMLAAPLYSMMGVGSMYSPFTGEILVNPDYPEMVVPMQIARAIAKQRGVADDGDASFVAYLVCTKYADVAAKTNKKYNFDYIKYSAYMDAYMEVGNVAYLANTNIHLYCTSALKEDAKKDMIAYVKALDALYGNTANLEFVAAMERTPSNDYLQLPKVLYMDFNQRVSDGHIKLTYNTNDNPVPVNSTIYYYMRYLVTDFVQHEAAWKNEATELWEEKNNKPELNDGSADSINPFQQNERPTPGASSESDET
ncbi:MAG: DUF3810 family protein [Clostridia bacterium]|nr:DUF3810 family protein [Clostridia bacterium]